MIGRIFQRKTRFRRDWPLRSQEEFEGTGRGGAGHPPRGELAEITVEHVDRFGRGEIVPGRF